MKIDYMPLKNGYSPALNINLFWGIKMYTLLLTADERSAIDFVGYRYAHGDELQRLLNIESESDPEVCWSDDQDILYLIPEHVAWQILDIGEEGKYTWTCFGPELVEKMTEFCDKIV